MRRGERALYERLLAEKDTYLRVLVAEIDYLRATRGQPSLAASLAPNGTLPDGATASTNESGWASEAEEAEAILADQGLSPVHLPEILDGLGYGSSDLS